MEIQEVGKKAMKKLGKNGLPIILGVGGLGLLAVMVSKSQSVDRTELVSPTGYTSYPDAVTNANVIIGEVNSNTKAEADRVIDAMGDSHDTLIGRFDQTDDYVQEGIDKILENTEKSQETVIGAITDAKGELQGSIQTSEGNVVTAVTGKMDSLNQQISSQLSQSLSKVTISAGLGSVLSGGSTSKNPVKKATGTVKGKIKDSTKKKKKSVSGAKYYKKTSYNGASIVQGLKKIGVDSSFSNRKKIAQANGIKDYSGTAAQNTKLLNLLKKGKLLKK